MATMRTRRLGWTIAAGAALLSLRPVGPFERVADLALVPARVLGFLGAPSLLWTGGERGEAGGASETLAAETLAAERELSAQLELAILRSAEPTEVPWPIRGVVPIPGEVDVSEKVNRDRISLRVADPGPIERGQAVVAGDVFVGTVEKVPVREPYRDRPGLLEKFLRRIGLSSPPVPPPRDLVIVRMITDPAARVGARIEEADGRSECRMVVGGLERLEDRVWLAVHNPESQNRFTGRVVVHEAAAAVDSADSVASGFLLGDLRRTTIAATERTPRRQVIGVDPLLDFEAGLNQVLVLTPGLGPGAVDPRRADIVGVLESTGWRHVDMASLGDLCPWRSTGRLDVGRNVGVRAGAAVVDGVRLVGRVARSDQIGATVALLDDPGFRVTALAQPADAPEATPLVLGELVSAGCDGSGRPTVRWSPASGSRHDEWIERHSEGSGEVEVLLWTGSGMRRVPRGLLLGRTSLRAPGEPGELGGELVMVLEGSGDPGARLQVRTGSSRLARPAKGSMVHAAEGER